MSSLFSRRKMIGAGGAAALAPMVAFSGLVEAAPPLQVTGPLFVMFEPIRVFDFAVEHPSIGGGKIVSGSSVGVSVGAFGVDNPAVVFVNITITETEGAGFILVRAIRSQWRASTPPDLQRQLVDQRADARPTSSSPRSAARTRWRSTLVAADGRTSSSTCRATYRRPRRDQSGATGGHGVDSGHEQPR